MSGPEADLAASFAAAPEEEESAPMNEEDGKEENQESAPANKGDGKDKKKRPLAPPPTPEERAKRREKDNARNLAKRRLENPDAQPGPQWKTSIRVTKKDANGKKPLECGIDPDTMQVVPAVSVEATLHDPPPALQAPLAL